MTGRYFDRKAEHCNGTVENYGSTMGHCDGTGVTCGTTRAHRWKSQAHGTVHHCGGRGFVWGR